MNEIKADRNSEGKSISGSAGGKKAYLIMNSKFSKKEKDFLLSKVNKELKVSDLKKLPNNEKTYKLYNSLNKDSKKDFINEINTMNINSTDLCKYYEKRKKLKSTYTSSAAKEQLTNYIKNSNFDDKTKWYLYNKDYGSDTQKLLVNTFNLKSTDYFNTMDYAKKISNQYKEKKYSNFRKRKVFEYINNLNCSQKQKIVLFSQAGYSSSTYKNSMYKYINSLDLTKSDKLKIWKSLY